MIRRGIVLAAALVLVGAVVAFAVESESSSGMTVSVEAEAAHYARLWASSEHTHMVNGRRAWRCCRACPQKTVPMMHEAFETDKDDVPEMAAAPPEDKKEEKKDEAKSFLEVSESRKRRKKKRTYSCCNMCPDLMVPFPRTWNQPSPYSYAPPPLFRFKQKYLADAVAHSQATAPTVFSEVSALVDAKRAGSGSGSGSEYTPTNPHDLPRYYYFESLRKAGAPRSAVQRDGKWDQPIRPGAAPVWHPPPPPHDDIFRISRSPNLHDGADLKTMVIMPPCCDFCMSTYFPHIINDELQLPKQEPYKIQPITPSKSASFLEVASQGEPKCCHKCVRKDIEDTDWMVYGIPAKKKKKCRGPRC